MRVKHTFGMDLEKLAREKWTDSVKKDESVTFLINLAMILGKGRILETVTLSNV